MIKILSMFVKAIVIVFVFTTALFVTTVSQQYDPHSLVDHHRRTSILEEYLMVGYHKSEDQESLPEVGLQSTMRLIPN